MERPIAYMGDQPYIFISYSHKDSERVWPIILKLQSEGYRIWYDDGISPGTEWDANIASHIRKCSFFAAFISTNYLESDNCKDELSFVRELKKNRVLIYLDEVTLPDEMQMRLGRLQAIYWTRLGEKKSLKKFHQSPGLNVCKEPVSSPVTPAPQAASQAAKSDARSPEEADSLANDSGEVDILPPETDPVQAGSAKIEPAKKNPMIFAGIGAALVLILAIALVFNKKPSDPAATSVSTASAESQAAESTASTDPQTDDSTSTAQGINVDDLNTDSAMMSVYENGVFIQEKGSPFAGILVANDVSSSTFSEQQKLDYNGDTYIVSQVPFITISSYDDQNSMILGFYDEYDAAFYYYGVYSVENGHLTISPGGSAGSFSEDCAPLTRELKYGFAIDEDYIELAYLDSKVKLNGCTRDSDTLILKGSLSEGSEPFNGLQSLDLVLYPQSNQLEKCTLIFSKDDITASAIIDKVSNYSNIHTIILNWNSFEYTLNGRQVTKDQYGSMNLKYICQYPAGFMIYNSTTGSVSYYQNQ